MKIIKTYINIFNDYLANKLSYLLSIMATFYVICLLVTIPLFYTQPSGFVAWASYLCSVVFQGIALPVLGYTAKKAGDKSDELMNKMYEISKSNEILIESIDAQQKHIEYLVELIESKQNNIELELDVIEKDLDVNK